MGNINIDLRENHTIGKHTRELIVSPKLCPALASHGLGLTGLSDASPEFRFVRPQPRWSQLLVCISGSGWVWVDGEWARCGPGMAYLTPPNVLHGYQSGDETPWRLCWVISHNHWHQGGGVAAEAPLLLEVDSRLLSSAVRGMHRELMQTAEPALLSHWASLVYAYSLRMVRPAGTETRLRRLWDLVEADLAYPWNVETLAERAAASGEHLRRLCRQQFGRSPMRQVTYLRMRQATALLASESYTIEAVAHQVGYENAFAFSTAFKRQMGLSPSEYRHNPDKTH